MNQTYAFIYLVVVTSVIIVIIQNYSQQIMVKYFLINQFYALVTGEEDAFYQMCMVLPEVIKSVVAKGGDVKVPHDTVAEGLKKIAEISGEKSENLAMALAVYMLGFSSYIGFSKLVDEKEDIDENFLNRIYAYARGIGV